MSAKRAERLQVMLTIDEVRRVEEWRYEHRMPSRSAAVRALMNLGLRTDAAVNEAALLEGSVSSRDVGVVENGSLVGSGEDRPAVLVICGDFLVGQGIGRVLEQAGYRLVGPARSEKEADSLAARNRLAAAVVEASAAGGEVPEWLSALRIPCVILGDAEEARAAKVSAAIVGRESAGERLGRAVADLIG